MYILTCPECQNESKVKRARVGATATCVNCSKLYKVDESTMRQEGGEAAAESPSKSPAAPAPVAAPPAAESPKMPAKARVIKTIPAGGDPSPMEALANVARSVSDVTEETEAERAAGVVAEIEAEFANEVPDAAGPNRWQRQARRKSGNKLLFPILIVLALGLGGVLMFVMMSGGDDPEPVVKAPSTNPKKDGDKKVNKDGAKKPPPKKDGKKRPPKKDGAKKPPPKKDGAKKPPPPPPPPPSSGPPVVELTRIPMAEWQKPFRPAPPVKVPDNPRTVRWESGTYGTPAGNRLLVGQFVGRGNQVFKNGMLHIDLLNNDGKAYLRMTQYVPVVPGGVGLDVRVNLPKTFGPDHKGLAAVFVPQNEQSQGVPLEMAELASRVLTSEGPQRTLRLGLRNATSAIAADPQVAIELLDELGAPLGSWAGQLSGMKIEPGDVGVFRAVLDVPAGARPGRLVVRGYGQKFP